MKSSKSKASFKRAVLVVHGGAGVIDRTSMTAALERQYRAALQRALQAGFKRLENGDTSLDAVEAAVRVLEDSPLFNAGRGAVFTHDGRIELDAAIMNGADLKAGAVTGITCVKNPVSAARAVMERSPHVLMMGEGANAFAKDVAVAAKLRIVEESYFGTEKRWRQLLSFLAKEGALPQGGMEFSMPGKDGEGKFGTVGAVAVDKEGNLAAATSTGGITGKKFGRTGDTPVIGAGTYADNATCAVSCTGHGEYFMRGVIGHEVSALIKHKGLKLKEAADQAVYGELAKLGGQGGLIAIDRRGRFAMPFNTPGMFRALITRDGEMRTDIYID